MFWGLIMEPNKRYSQTVEKAFHVSMASLDVSTASEDVVQVMLCYDKRNYLLCNLKSGSHWQVPLDLNFKEGSKIAFTLNGGGHVHLTGYLLPEDDLDDFDEMEGEEEEEDEDESEIPQLVGKQGKRKAQKSPTDAKSTKRLKALVSSIEELEADSSDDDSGDDDDDDDDDDNTYALAEETHFEVDGNDSDESGEDEDEEEEEEDSDEEEEEEVEDTKSKKQNKQNNKQVQQQKQQPQQQQKNQKAQKQQNLTNGKDAKPKQVNKEEQKQAQNNVQAQKKKVIAGGVQIEEIKVGNGVPAKQGKFVSVYYVGRLKNGKKFDATTQGDGFKFRLGKGEVIKGWDIGVQGMKVGGKRRITIPPGMAYGAEGSPPVIPGNSTLIFEVELKNVR